MCPPDVYEGFQVLGRRKGRPPQFADHPTNGALSSTKNARVSLHWYDNRPPVITFSKTRLYSPVSEKSDRPQTDPSTFVVYRDIYDSNFRPWSNFSVINTQI